MSTDSDAVDGVQHEDDRRAMSEEPPEELAALPFFDVGTNDAAKVRVRAGWSNGEDVDLVIDAQVGMGSAQDQLLTAFNWWRDRWVEILQASQEPVEEPAEE